MKKTFIKNKTILKNYEDNFYSPAVKMRRTFYINDIKSSTLTVCGLGYGYYYLNGKKVSNDLLTSAVSNYDKTLWYNSYDVTSLLQKGKNVLCVILGNGFYNENFDTPWGHNKASWRDVPKVCLELKCGNFTLNADEKFKTIIDNATYYNQLRIGEFYNSNYEDGWLNIDYDDSLWENAVYDDKTPKGRLKKCVAQPIIECEEYNCINVLENSKGYVFDFGQNLSGYIRIRVNEPCKTILQIEYAEEIDENNNLKLNGLDCFYKPFQVDKIICNGKEFIWSPKFTYHGFRYAQISGLTTKLDKNNIKSIFVHQDVKRKSEFECSYPLLNKIFNAGIMSTYSNMHYVLTDCPTREKLGWINDSACSAEQIWLNFDVKNFMRKYAVDLVDAIKKDGSAHGIVPTNGCQHNLGPVTDAFYYFLAYYQYLFYKDKTTINKILPSCIKNLKYLINELKSGKDFVLADWNGIDNLSTPKDLIFSLYIVEFIDKLQFIIKNEFGEYDQELNNERVYFINYVKEKYINNGESLISEQTAISMLICHNIGDKDKLSQQLENIIINKDNKHLNVGMVGLRFVLDALAIVGKQDLALEMISNDTPPSYASWFNEGATTLWENFGNALTVSKNHHLFSSVLAWIIKYVLGVRVNESGQVDIKPLKFEKISTVKGKIKVFDKIYNITINNGKIV